MKNNDGNNIMSRTVENNQSKKTGSNLPDIRPFMMHHDGFLMAPPQVDNELQISVLNPAPKDE